MQLKSIKILMISSIAVLGLLTFVTANASTLGQTSDHSISVNPTPSAQTWVFTPDTNQSINRIKLWTDTTYTGSQSLRILDTNGSVIATGTATILSGETTFVFPTDIDLVSGTKYALHAQTFIFFGAPYNGATDYDSKGCKEYSYTVGTTLGTCGAGNTQEKADPYSVFSYTITPPTVSILYPTTSIDGDFANWEIIYNGGSVNNTGYIQVDYGPASTTLPWSDKFAGTLNFTTGTSTILVPKSRSLSFLSLPSTWEARVSYKALINLPGYDTTIASSATTTFTITGTNYNVNGTSTENPFFNNTTEELALIKSLATSTIGLEDCAGYGALDPSGWACWTGNTFKKAFIWAFGFNDTLTEMFNAVMADMRTAFPLNWLIGFGADVAQLYSSPTTTPNLLVSIPTTGFATSSIQIFDLASTTAWVNQTNDWTGTIKTVLGWFLWIEFLTSLIIFWKIKPQIHS